jgi:hypothetical protein
MDQKLICFSACAPNVLEKYNRTVLHPVDLHKFDLNIDGVTKASIWGMSVLKRWQSINSGDFALFYSGRKFISYGKVVSTLDRPDIARALWASPLYRYLVLMSPVVPITCPRDKFWKVFGYSERYSIQGFVIPRRDVLYQAKEEYGSLESFLEQVLDIDEIVV